jgi:LysR family transcriptional regulator, glycine cleavage system transcriptional activator
VEDWRGTLFQNHLAIEAAEAGQGFALSDQILSTDRFSKAGSRPFAFDMKDHWHYWIVRGKGRKETPPVRAFREWLMSEIADTNRKYAQRPARSPQPLRPSPSRPSVRRLPDSESRPCPPRNTTA